MEIKETRPFGTGFSANIHNTDGMLFATVYGSTAQECESRAMLIVKAEENTELIKKMLGKINELIDEEGANPKNYAVGYFRFHNDLCRLNLEIEEALKPTNQG